MANKQQPPTVSLEDLGEDGRKIVDRLNSSGEAVVVTDRGRPAAVLVSLESYQQDEKDRHLLRLLALGVDPILEVLPCNPPLPAELDCRKATGTQLARNDERRHIHVFTDVGDGEPFFVDVDGDAVHVSVLPDSRPLV